MRDYPHRHPYTSGRSTVVLQTLSQHGASTVATETTHKAKLRCGTRVRAAAVRSIVSLAVIASAFLLTAWLGGTPPFEGSRSDPYSENRVMRALPFDAPLPNDMSLAVAGYGDDLPYHAQWTSQAPLAELVAQYEANLAASPKWRILTTETKANGGLDATLARSSSDGILTHFAKLSVSRDATQSVIAFNFTPIPSSLAPDPN